MARVIILASSKSLKDFAAFGTAMIQSGDIDPQFWVLRDYYKRKKIDRNTSLWLSLIYLTFYHLGSTAVAWELYPEPERIEEPDWDRSLVFFKQRRLFRGNLNALVHLNAVLELADGDFRKWTEDAIGDGGTEGWVRVREAYASLPYTGPWSSYKWCDMIKFVHEYPITAPDIGNKPGDTAGPIAGLATLFGLSWYDAAKDVELPKKLYDYVTGELGMPLMGLDHLESCLCDWQSITRGRYYHGHDIDRDLAQLRTCDWRSEIAQAFLEARSRIFDVRLLGERQCDDIFGMWTGPRAELKLAYARRGELVCIYPDVKRVKLL